MAAHTYPGMNTLLIHRPPMVLIDRLVDTSDQASTCEVTIGPQTLFLEPAGVPAYVGLEYMAQAIAAHGGYKSYQAGVPVEMGFLLGTSQWQSFCQFFEVGQTLCIHVRHVWGDLQFMRFRCIITDATTGARLQQGEVNVFKPKDVQRYISRGL